MSSVPETIDKTIDKTIDEKINETLKEMKISWYYRWFPFLPRFINDKELRLYTVLWRDCSYCEKAVGKSHGIDYLIENHKSVWYKLPLVGVQVWY